MKNAFATAVLAATIGFASTVSQAQQAQRFGRDSVYAVPGATKADRPSEPAVVDAPKLQPYGRDSVYASQTKGPTTPVAPDANGLQAYGRDSVYAIKFQQPATADTRTAVGSDDKAHGG